MTLPDVLRPFPSPVQKPDGTVDPFVVRGNDNVLAERLNAVIDYLAALPPSSGSTKGTATLDFGAFPGSTNTSVAVTGQAGILGTSTVRAWLTTTGTADHSADEHIMAATRMGITVGAIVAGTGFTIYATWDEQVYGTDPAPVEQNRNGPGGRSSNASRTTGSDGRMWGQFTVAWEWS